MYNVSMAKITDSDIERILKVKNADLGLFVLAMHSLMERALKENFASNSDFGVLVNQYVDEFKFKYGTPRNDGTGFFDFPRQYKEIFSSISKLYRNHFLSNDVRHKFAEISEEDAQTTVACFMGFARAEGWDALSTIKKLEKELKNWEEHGSYESEE